VNGARLDIGAAGPMWLDQQQEDCMQSTKHALALAAILAAVVLSACAGGSTYSGSERSGSTGTRATWDDDRGPQARNSNAYMRQ
jgi:hypothetical protein